MTAAPCVFCGRPAAHRHHWTARLSPGGPSLDPTATVPVCVRCHHGEHAAWRAVGLDRFAEPLVARVARTCWTIGRLADLGRPVTLDPVTLRGLHEVLLAIGRQVDDLAARVGS